MSQDNIIITRVSAYEFFRKSSRRKLWPMWQYIVRQLESTGECTITRKEMMLSLGVSKRTIANHILELYELGLINRINHGRNGIEIAIIDTLDIKEARKGARKEASLVKESVKEANEVNHTTLFDKDLVVKEASVSKETDDKYLEPILDNNTYIKPNIYIDNIPIIDTIPKIGIRPIGPSELENNTAPSLPMTSKQFVTTDPKFPLKGVGSHVSAIWYWAVKRYEIHSFDFLMLKDTFAKMAAKFSKTIPKYVGKSFEDMQKFVDWYLSLDDKFVADQTQYGFEFMVSGSCINKYLADSNKKQQTMVSTNEERSKLRGKWHR